MSLGAEFEVGGYQFPPDMGSKKHTLRPRAALAAAEPAENEIRVAHHKVAGVYAAYGYVAFKHKGFRVVVVKGTGFAVEKAVEVALVMRADERLPPLHQVGRACVRACACVCVCARARARVARAWVFCARAGCAC
jgi:hypothetical protein